MKTLKGFLLALLACCLLGAGFGRAVYDYLLVNNYIEIGASAAPAVSGAAVARFYVDSSDNTLNYSVNGNSYIKMPSTVPAAKMNWIINGDGGIAQRNGTDANLSNLNNAGTLSSVGIIQPTTDKYACDRWKVSSGLLAGGNGVQVSVCNPFGGYQATVKSLTSNVASITLGTGTTTGGQFYQGPSGQHLIVALNPSDATFDGTQTHTNTASCSTTVSYPVTHANVGSASVGGILREQSLDANTYMGYTQTTTGGKLMTYQVLEAANTNQLRGQQVIVQFKAKGQLSGDLCAAIISDSTAASNNGAFSPGCNLWPNPLINTWSAVSGTNPTFNTGSNVFSLSFVAPSSVSGGSVSNGVAHFTLGADWTQYYYITTLPTDFIQIGVCFYMNTVNATGQEQFQLTEIGMYQSIELQPYMPRHPAQELALCQRYCYALNSTGTNTVVTQCRMNSTSAGNFVFRFPVDMRIMPSFTATAADWQADDGVAAAVFNGISMNGSANSSYQFGYCTYSQAGTTWAGGRGGVIYSTANNKRMIFDADY